MIKIRDAVPEDAEDVARIMDLSGTQQLVLPSFEGEQKIPSFEVIFPGPEDERLRILTWFVLNGDRVQAHYSRFKVADIDGRIAGGLCTHTRDHDRISKWVKAFRKKGISYREIIACNWRLLPYHRAHTPIPENTLVVDFVATFPEFQRRGVITALLEDAIEKAGREGYPRMQVSTFIGNAASQSAYEKVGFRVDEKRTNRSFERLFGSPGMVRLTLEL